VLSHVRHDRDEGETVARAVLELDQAYRVRLADGSAQLVAACGLDAAVPAAS
jgi:hypothetical protein